MKKYILLAALVPSLCRADVVLKSLVKYGPSTSYTTNQSTTSTKGHKVTSTNSIDTNKENDYSLGLGIQFISPTSDLSFEGGCFFDQTIMLGIGYRL